MSSMSKQKRKARRDTIRRQNQINDAIMKIESEKPLKEWGPKQLKKELGNEVSYRRILSHLKKFVKDGYLRKLERGRYLSKNSLFWEAMLKKWIIRQNSEEVLNVLNLFMVKFTAATVRYKREKPSNVLHISKEAAKEVVKSLEAIEDVYSLKNFEASS